jgi:hypothetical protein
MIIYIKLNVGTSIARPAVGIDFTNAQSVLLTALSTVEQGTVLPSLPQGEVTISIRVKRVAFLPGTYTSNFWMMSPEGHTYVRTEDCIVFEIARVPIYGTSDATIGGGAYTRISNLQSSLVWIICSLERRWRP